MKSMRLSNFVELLVYPNGKWGWRFDMQGRKSEMRRPDKSLYTERRTALEAAASALEEKYRRKIIIDEPSEVLMRQPKAELLDRGEKRQRTGGHGYSGGDGFKRIK